MMRVFAAVTMVTGVSDRSDWSKGGVGGESTKIKDPTAAGKVIGGTG